MDKQLIKNVSRLNVYGGCIAHIKNQKWNPIFYNKNIIDVVISERDDIVNKGTRSIYIHLPTTLNSNWSVDIDSINAADSCEGSWSYLNSEYLVTSPLEENSTISISQLLNRITNKNKQWLVSEELITLNSIGTYSPQFKPKKVFKHLRSAIEYWEVLNNINDDSWMNNLMLVDVDDS